MKRTTVLIAFAAAAVAAHAGPADMQTVFRSGKWKVGRHIDPMTDKPVCKGGYESNFIVGLDEKALYLKPEGGVKSVALRFDSAPGQPLRLPSEVEKATDIVVIDGADFALLQKSARLRAQVFTHGNAFPIMDIDLRGLNEALDYIRNRCAAESAQAPAAAPAPQEVSACPDELSARMRAAKISAAQIAAVCGK